MFSRFFSGFPSPFSCRCNATGPTDSEDTHSEQTTTLQSRSVAPPPSTPNTVGAEVNTEFLEPRDNNRNWRINQVDVSDSSSEMSAGSSDADQLIGFILEDPSDVEASDDGAPEGDGQNLEDLSDVEDSDDGAPEGDDQSIGIKEVTTEFVNNQTERALKIAYKFCKSATDSHTGLNQEDRNTVGDIISDAIACIMDSDTITFDDYKKHIQQIKQIKQITNDLNTKQLITSCLKPAIKFINNKLNRNLGTVEIPSDDLPEELTDSVFFDTFTNAEPMYVLCTKNSKNGKQGENWHFYRATTISNFVKYKRILDPHNNLEITGFMRVVIVDPVDPTPIVAPTTTSWWSIPVISA